MRFNQFSLTRFGKFTDQHIDLPQRKNDMHIVVGPNEAGKSTFQTAIAELLFGIDTRSPFNFIHEHRDMALAAELRHGEESLQVVRLKKRNDNLRDGDGNPLSANALTPFLGSVDRAFFDRMFALTHDGLVQGGLDILNAKDDVARMLFEASAGVGSLGEFRDSLEAEAKKLWGKRKVGDRAYDNALARHKAAETALKEATIDVAAWKKSKNNLQEAHNSLDQINRELRALDQTQHRLERIRRVAPQLSMRKQQLLQRSQHSEVVSLPEDSAEILSTARQDIDRAERAIAEQQALLKEFANSRASITVDTRLLEEKETVRQLEERRIRMLGYPADIAKRQTEIQTLQQAVDRDVADLGWDKADSDQLIARIPSRVLRAEILELLQAHGRLEQACVGKEEALATRQTALATQQSEIAQLSNQGTPAFLQVQLDNARALGDVRGRKTSLARQVHEAQALLEEAHQQLQGQHDMRCIESLRALPVPSQSHVRDVQETQAKLRESLASAMRQLADTEQQLATRMLDIAQFERTKATVSRQALGDARASRDDLWSQIRGGAQDPKACAETYEGHVLEADTLADRRYQDAENVNKLEYLQNDVERLQLNAQHQRTEIASLEQAQQCAQAEWATIAERLGVPGLTISAMPDWRAQREQVLQADRTLADARSTEHEFLTKESEASTGLLAALGAAAPAVEGNAYTPPPAASLPTLIKLAEQISADAERAKLRHVDLERECAQGNATLQTLRNDAILARARLAQWNDDWAARLSLANLSPDLGLQGAGAALDLQQQLLDTLKAIDELRRTRIDTMQRDLEAFATDAIPLIGELAPKLSPVPHDQGIAALAKKLLEAESASETLLRLKHDIAKASAAKLQAERSCSEAKASIQPLLDLANVDTTQALAQAIVQSEQLLALNSAIKISTEATLRAGDGLDLEQLETEVAAEDLTTLEATLHGLVGDRAATAAKRDTCLKELNEAQLQCDKIGGQDTAASAAAQREEALADMGDAVERYIKLAIAVRLLRWSIDRYRQEKQGPLLGRASQSFAELTLGSFERLEVDFEGSKPELLAVRPGGQCTPISGLSTATRDQLFMSLRLAAIELHLDAGQALPFLADDLFINYDDARSRAGFQVLAKLAKRTQVIFLTHHAHLVPMAREVLGEGLNVIELEK